MNPRRYISVLAAAVASFSCLSCSITRRLPEGQYLLSHTEIHVKKDKDIPRQERITAEDIEPYARHNPARRFLGIGFGMGIYSLANPEKDNGFNRWLRRIGTAPVIFDSALVKADAARMGDYIRSRGFRAGGVDYSVQIKGKRAGVIYDAVQGAPYRIGSVSYRFQDLFLEPIVRADSANTLIHTGDLYDMEALQNERRRIASYLNGEGYYAVSVNNIRYVADTLAGDRSVDLTVVINQHIAGYDQQTLPILENNAVYRIRDIYVHTDHDPSPATSDPGYRDGLDTLEYRGVNFIYRGRMNVKPEVLLRAINIYPGYLYNDADVKRASDNMVRLDYFRGVNILFSEVADSTANMVTFIDGSGENHTAERYLDCNIICTPGKKHGIGIDAEATVTSSYSGLLATIGYHNRNIFRGAELLDVSVTGGYEFMHDKSRRNSVEAGGMVSLAFPKFLTPFRVDRYNMAVNARSRIEFSINSQDRPYYNRLLLSGSIGYSWSNRRYSSFTFRPLDVSMIRMGSIDGDFLASLENPYLLNSYTSQFILGLSGSYLYNNQARGEGRNTFRLRVNAETGGNLLDLISHMAFEKPADGYYKIFGIQYSQYARADIDMSYRIFTGRRTSLVYRLYAGHAHPYGNFKSVPFERLFYAGGPGSMRGWVARTLGPGTTPAKEGGYPRQLANFKLEANAEFRFPLSGVFNGAVFFDTGNIWMVGRGADDESEFRVGSFYEQLGLAGGLGLRLDFSFFLLRMDWGLRIHDPGKPYGHRWIEKPTLNQGSFNFGIGYPF